MNTACPARRSLCVLAAASLLTAGCAGPPPRADRYVPPPQGAVTVYEVTDSGSFGTAVRRVPIRMGMLDFEGRRLLRYETPAGSTLQNDRVGVVALIDPRGEPAARYDPPMEWPWPLEVGKTATTRHQLTLLPAGRTVPLSVDWRIEAQEDVTVPAGSFRTWRIVFTDSMGQRVTLWSVPEGMGMFARRVIERLPNHPQGAGRQDWVMTQRPTVP